jgi:glycerol kinase
VSSYILSVDQGTTGCRALLVDKKGFIKVKSYREFPQYFPHPGWVEHDPSEILQCVHAVIRETIAKARISPLKIAAIGITNQRETTVVWDASSGRPVHRAIVWQDRRTADLCAALRKRGYEAEVREKTGLVIDPYFSGSKLLWLFRNLPSLRKRKVLFGTMDSWLLWNFTAKSHATDFSNASRTLLLNIRTRTWDKELLKIFEVPASCLPEARSSGGLFGKTARVGAFPAGIPVYSMIGDQQAALYGQACYAPGSMKNTYGTGCFLVLNTGAKKVRPKSGLLATLACDRKGKPVYALEGSIFIGGAAVQWIRDGLRLIGKARETEKMASQIPDTGGVYLVPAFVGLGAPYWDSRCRGGIFGITRGTGREAIVRAALESIAYQTVDVVRAMKGASRLAIRELKVDGGATENNWLMQFQADMLGLPVARSFVAESTAWGAAKLAGVASGFWSDPAEVDRSLRYDRFSPRMSRARRETLYGGWQESVSRILTLEGKSRWK